MLLGLLTGRSFKNRTNSGRLKSRNRSRLRRSKLESLELRQMLSGSPVVAVDDVYTLRQDTNLNTTGQAILPAPYPAPSQLNSIAVVYPASQLQISSQYKLLFV